MAVAFRAAGTFAHGAGSGAALVLPYPAGVASGDLLVIHYCGSSGTTTTTPSGWTKLFGPTNLSGNGNRAHVFYKIAGGSEPSTVSIAIDFGEGAGVMSAFSGVNTTTPIDVFATATLATGGNTSFTSPSVTTTQAATMLLRLNWVWSGTTVTPPGSDTERWDANWVSQDQPFEGATSTQASAGASGTTTYTSGGTEFGGLGATIAIAPATVSAPVADFTGTPLSGSRPLSVAFTDSSSNGPTSWAWTFGDGGTSTSQNPTHSYTTAGTFTVVLVATNAGGSNTKTRTSYVVVSNPSGTFVKIKWGDRFVVTDEGGGVIRVDFV